MMLPDYPFMFWIAAIIAVTSFSMAKTGFGSGVGIIATPLLSLTIPVTDAVAILLPLLILTDIQAVSHYRFNFDRRSIKLMIPGAMVGIALGGLFFGYFRGNQRILQFSIGLLALGFVAFQILRVAILGYIEKRRPRAIEGIFMGGLSGFISTLAHAGGPPVVIYLLPQKFPRGLYVGTTVLFFTAVNMTKLIPYYALDLLRVGNLTTIIILAPLTYMGVRLGVFLNQRFSDLWFNRVVYIILFLTGLQLVVGRSIVSLIFGG
ncbi:sulfite exporter TauE/SafE family protein [Thermodesulfobacteriota bacterium]